MTTTTTTQPRPVFYPCLAELKALQASGELIKLAGIVGQVIGIRPALDDSGEHIGHTVVMREQGSYVGPLGYIGTVLVRDA